MKKTKNKPERFGVIHLGSEQIGIQIVEYTDISDIKVISQAFKSVNLGEETFKTKKISFSTLRDTCEILKGFSRMLCEYGVRDYRLVATTAIREAANQRYVIDQIRVKTGFRVEVVDMPQEIFYKYSALFKAVKRGGFTDNKEAILFVDISSGGLGFTLYKKEKIIYQQNIHIGALRIKESFEKNQRESVRFSQALIEYISSTISPVKLELQKHKIKYLVLSGNETNMTLTMMGRNPQDELSIIENHEFASLYNKLNTLSIPYIMNYYNLSEARAELVLPTIILYREILNLTDVGLILVPQTSFSDGVTLHQIAEKTDSHFRNEMQEQLLSLAYAIGHKYSFDVKHAEAVSNRALVLFDHLHKVHGLGKRERFLLKTTGILHDIGKYINLRKHYFYSYQLILSSDIFGFSKDEKRIIANVAYYHSKGTPTEIDANFHVLNEEEKTLVAKLSAIMRLADALDRSHRQKSDEFIVQYKSDTLNIYHDSVDDMTLEEWTFGYKSHFFEEVFGIRAVLHKKGR